MQEGIQGASEHCSGPGAVWELCCYFCLSSRAIQTILLEHPGAPYLSHVAIDCPGPFVEYTVTQFTALAVDLDMVDGKTALPLEP